MEDVLARDEGESRTEAQGEKGPDADRGRVQMDGVIRAISK